MKGGKEFETEEKFIQSEDAIHDKLDFVTSTSDHKDKEVQTIVAKRSIPPPGDGQRIYEIDPLLRNHRDHLDYR